MTAPEHSQSQQPQQPGTVKKNVALGFFLCVLYISISSLLINFNKFILQKFPYPWELTAMQMFGSSLLSSVFYMTSPGLFPAMERLQGRRLELLRYFVPLGAFFAIALYASNKAYLYCTVSFLQFMKESNVALVFLLCCAVGLQKLDRVKMMVIVWILASSWTCIREEQNFSLVGFGIQAISQLAECTKNVLGEHIMSGTNFRLDPLSYTMFMAPVALCFLSMGAARTWQWSLVEDAHKCWYLLLPNALLAFGLNVVIAFVLKHCSAMSFILSGVVKDIVIVLGSVSMFGDVITHVQYVSFAITLAGCVAWSLLKIVPNGQLALLLRTVTMMPEDKTESLPLIAKMATSPKRITKQVE